MKTRFWIWLGLVFTTSCFLLTNLSFLGCEYNRMYGLSRGVGGGQPPEWSKTILMTYDGFSARACFVLSVMFVLYGLPVLSLWLFSFSRVIRCLILSGLGALTLANIMVFSETYLAQLYCQTACGDIEIIAVLQVIFGPVSLAFGLIASCVIICWRAVHSSRDT